MHRLPSISYSAKKITFVLLIFITSFLLKEARNIATERMMQEAKDLGADAIVAIRYSTSAIMDTASEVMAYGTAVKLI